MSSLELLDSLRRRPAPSKLGLSTPVGSKAGIEPTSWRLVHYSKLAHFRDYDLSPNEQSNLQASNLSYNQNYNLNHAMDRDRNHLESTRQTPETAHGLNLKHFDHLAQLSCDSGEMILRLNFSEPFKGIVYPDHNRVSACRFFGDGHHNYELRLPLRGCGTRQVSVRRPIIGP